MDNGGLPKGDTHTSLARLGYLDFLTPALCWQIRQNKPRLIARDLAHYGVPHDVTYGVLLARGVFKWLAVREKLIRLKYTWKERVNGTLSELRAHKASQVNDPYELGYLRGYLTAVQECRREVRKLCHSDRWQAPDDREAQKFLEHMTQGGKDVEAVESPTAS